jgi:hypothetical protein
VPVKHEQNNNPNQQNEPGDRDKPTKESKDGFRFRMVLRN